MKIAFSFFFVIYSAPGKRALAARFIEPSENGSKLHRTSNRYNNIIAIASSDAENVPSELSIADYFPFRKSINLIEKLHYILQRAESRGREMS